MAFFFCGRHGHHNMIVNMMVMNLLPCVHFGSTANGITTCRNFINIGFRCTTLFRHLHDTHAFQNSQVLKHLIKANLNKHLYILFLLWAAAGQVVCLLYRIPERAL